MNSLHLIKKYARVWNKAAWVQRLMWRQQEMQYMWNYQHPFDGRNYQHPFYRQNLRRFTGKI